MIMDEGGRRMREEQRLTELEALRGLTEAQVLDAAKELDERSIAAGGCVKKFDSFDYEQYFEKARAKEVEKPTLIVNLYGGPGTGKSTTAAGVFHDLKTKGIKCELVHEFAKQLTWEERLAALNWQPYIFGKQSMAIRRLQGKTDVIITDSPILLSSHIYRKTDDDYDSEALEHLGESVHKSWWTLDVFMVRNTALHPFVQAGRNQDQKESEAIDNRTMSLLDFLGIPFKYVPVDDESVGAVVGYVEDYLQGWEDHA